MVYIQTLPAASYSMPRRKIQSASSMRVEKTKSRSKKAHTEKPKFFQSTPAVKKESGLSRWKWGESYTSLLLGIVVVIVAVLFGVTLVKQHKNLQETSSIQASPSVTAPTNTPSQIKEGKEFYTVKAGDDLWKISEKFYQSGYNWVDIAKANNLEDPSTIHVGNQLVIPSVTPLQKTVTPSPTPQVVQPNAITGNTYTVQKGDDLWNIAVRAYGDGYKWVDIAKANNLQNPNLLFSGNTLQIPR